jgi:hypothetical protein
MDYPPILHGSMDSQLRQLRDYLVRLAEKINELEVQAKE